MFGQRLDGFYQTRPPLLWSINMRQSLLVRDRPCGRVSAQSLESLGSMARAVGEEGAHEVFASLSNSQLGLQKRSVGL